MGFPAVQTNDLFEAASRACDSYWRGSDASKIILREAMTDLRFCVEAEKKLRAKSETVTLLNPSREHA